MPLSGAGSVAGGAGRAARGARRAAAAVIAARAAREAGGDVVRPRRETTCQAAGTSEDIEPVIISFRTILKIDMSYF